MAIDECKDIENGLENLEQPFLENAKIVDSEDEELISKENGSIGMVLLSTCVAVCGSFEFGSCVSISIFLLMFFLFFPVKGTGKIFVYFSFLKRFINWFSFFPFVFLVRTMKF